MNNFNLKFVTFFGIGNIKFAPGSVASALTCFIFYIIIKYIPNSFWFLLTIFFLILTYAPYAINQTLQNFDNDDPGQIVIDEVIGMLIPLIFLSLAFHITILPGFIQNIVSVIWFLDSSTMLDQVYAIFYFKYFVLINFLLFRFFDIIKPFPIAYVDRNFTSGWGIILDDILAGIYCLLVPFILSMLSVFFNLIDF